eukprot:1621994-Pleurochrysis_carterae.AAC.1
MRARAAPTRRRRPPASAPRQASDPLRTKAHAQARPWADWAQTRVPRGDEGRGGGHAWALEKRGVEARSNRESSVTTEDAWQKQARRLAGGATAGT